MPTDLHCHTIMSDGAVALDEIILLARNSGLKAISITDHDTFAGVVRAKIFGSKHGIDVVEGIEISAFDYKRNRKVHILAYMCEYPNRLMGMFKKTAESRRKAMNIAIQKVTRLYKIPPEMILRRAQRSTNIYKQHIMQALVDAGYDDTLYGDVHNKLFNPKTGFARANIEYPNVFDVIDLVHDAGGVAVMAHPATYDSYDLLSELAEYGLDGVERYYPDAIPEDDSMLADIALKYNLLTTAGTDFHGANSQYPLAIGSYTADDDIIDKIKKRRSKYLE